MRPDASGPLGDGSATIPAASLRVLAAWADTFAAPTPTGRWLGGEPGPDGTIGMPRYEGSAEIRRFVAEMTGTGLVRPIDWMAWAATPGAQRLIRDPAEIAHATHDELIALLTTIIRGERFSDGEIAAAYERGTLLAIAERARALLGTEPGQPSGSPSTSPRHGAAPSETRGDGA